jgi:hypothetical protein
MPTSLPSLEILLDLNRAEREIQLTHFEALDAKAGVVLGFSGVLVALGVDGTEWWSRSSLVVAVCAAALAVWAFWPRHLPAIMPTPLGDYVGSEATFTMLRLLDTLELMINETATLLLKKSRRLKLAMMALTAAAAASATAQLVG